MRLSFALGSVYAFVVTASLQAQQAVPGPNPAQLRPAQPSPYPPPLYQMGDVPKYLSLTPQQVDRLNQQTEQLQKRYNDDFNRLSTLTPAERLQRSNELTQRYSTDWMKGAREIFNENQLNRYQQLNYQYGGFNTFSDPDVQKRLSLSDEQRNNLRQGIDWSSQQMQEINRLGATDREKATQMYRDYQRANQERINKFLTPEQQKTWQQMTGETYNFPPAFTTTQPRRER